MLHHLSDEVAVVVLEAVRQQLRPGGKLITLGPVFTPKQGGLDRWIVSRTRGQYVRTQDQTEALAEGYFCTVQSQVVVGLMRIPYSLVFWSALPEGTPAQSSAQAS